ncbi:MAG: hypothetical protein GXP33_08385 [Spirochaetes bacterium]|nr:hypothetical protein [Spirochaetota bacterium]
MVRFIPLKDDLITSAADTIINEHGGNFEKVSVIFPTRRIQYFLLDNFSRRLKKDFLPPLTLTVDDFFEKIFKDLHPGFYKIREIEASYHIYTILKNYSIRFIKTGTGFIQAFPWVLQILSAVESLLTESKDIAPSLGQYKEFVALGNYSKDYQTLIRILPEITDKFLKTLTAGKQYTRGMTYRLVADLVINGRIPLDDNSYYFLGFHSLNHCEKTLFKDIFKRFKAALLLHTDKAAIYRETSPFHLHKRILKDLDLSFPIPGSDNEVWNKFLNKVEIHELPDTETEIAEAAGLFLKNLHNKNTDQLKKTALILPDASTLIPLIHGMVSRTENIPFNISLQYPFNRTALYQLIDNMLILIENRKGRLINAQDYLNIVRHPYIKLLDTTESGLLKNAIHLIENHILKNNLIKITAEEIKNGLKKEAESLAGDEQQELFAFMEDIHSTFIISGSPGFKDIIDFLFKAVDKIYLISKKYLFLNEYLVFAFETLEEINRTAGSISLESETDINSIADFIRYYFSQQKVPFQGSPLKGIQILGMLETRGLQFDEVFIFDTVEGILPEGRKYDPILPHDIKRIFGLRNYVEWEKLFAHNFFSLLAGAHSVHLFYPKTKEGKSISRSRYIEYILYKIEEESGKSYDLKTINTPFAVNRPENRLIEKNKDILAVCRTLKYSPSSIEKYLKCPMMFYYDKILNLKEKEELKPELDAATQGLIIHAVLKDIFLIRSKGGSPADEITGHLLINSIKKHFKENGFNPESGTMKLRIWGITRQLERFIPDEFLHITEDGAAVKYLEHNLKSSLIVNGNTFRLHGRADRVDRIGSTYRIIDYKTGSSFSVHRKEQYGDIFKDFLNNRTGPGRNNPGNVQKLYDSFLSAYPALQMYLYMIMFSETAGRPAGTIDGEYIFLQELRKDKQRVPVFKDYPEDKRRSLMETFVRGLKTVLSDIISPELPFYTVSDRNKCEYCSYTTLCKK